MVVHGRGGWTLEDYDWDPETGLAKLTYERLRTDTDEVQEKIVFKAQPYAPHHAKILNPGTTVARSEPGMASGATPTRECL